jgi:branched-chain amino acid transport system substrate-binding protein
MNPAKLIKAGGLAALLAALMLPLPGASFAADDIKIGFVAPMSGPFAGYGPQMLNGIRLYMNEHGDKIGDRKVTLLIKDDVATPDISKRAAQDLINQDKVELLMGFGVTPPTVAAATVSAQAKMPMVVLNAATSSVVDRSPYIVRTSMIMPQLAAPMAIWAAKNGVKNVHTLVSDYGPGHDAEKQFIKTFTEAGGKIVGSIHAPLQNPDYAPFLQRIKDVKPDAVFLFVPAGEQSVSFLKGFEDRGLRAMGIKILSTGDLVDEDVLDSTGDAALGAITSFHYSEAHPSAKNQAYTSAYYKAYPNKRPNFMSIAGYDGMHLIYSVLKKTGGDTSGDAFVAAAKGMNWESPRGPISIDPATRDIVQNIYIRKVERVDGKLQNVEFDVVPNFKDPSR